MAVNLDAAIKYSEKEGISKAIHLKYPLLI